MKKLSLTICAFAFFASAAIAQREQKPLYYAISFPNAAHHEAEFVLTIPQVPMGPLRLHMSRSSTGRYATHEFGKNVYNVKATNADGTPLIVKQIEGEVYEIAEHGDNVKVSYTLFGNWTDGTYASIDPSHAHLNTPASFMWVVGLDQRAIKFEFNDLDKYGWKVATQLKHESLNVYSAPGMQYMMDSPIELSAFKEASWDVINPGGKKQRINLTVHSVDDQGVVDNFSTMVQKVVLEEQAVFGELPVYDYGEYTFLDDVYPTLAGDGMEHRNSTCIVQPSEKVGGNEVRLLGTFAHEYFHSWNVKRIRPKSLEPFNFDHANMSNELWFAEGFTQYYGGLMLVRAGYVTPEAYANSLNGLVNSVLNSPGAAKYPAVEMSRKAVYVDAGVSVDPTNYGNNFLSYYTYGGAIALALDLRLRTEFNLTLDDYMHAVWLAQGKVMKPYTVPDLQNVLGKLTNPKFAADFYNRYVYGIDKNNYKALLEKAGYVLRKAAPGKVWSGIAAVPQRGRNGQARTVATEAGFAITANTNAGTPLYNAGIDAGDIILKADGKDIADAAAFAQAISDKKPGDKITVDYKNRTGAHTTIVTLTENPNYEVVTAEKAGATLTPEQAAFRKSWLSSKAK